jgi:hypothetical protein
MILIETDQYKLKINSSNQNAVLKITKGSDIIASISAPGPILYTSTPPVLRFASNLLLGELPTNNISSENYKVWACHWVSYTSGPRGGGLQGTTLHWNEFGTTLPVGETPQNPFKTIVPPARPFFYPCNNIDCQGITIADNNAYRCPGELSDCTDNINLVISDCARKLIARPNGKRVLHFYPWSSDFPSVNINFENYYKNTNDGITFNGEKFSSLWPEKQKRDHYQSYREFLRRVVEYAIGNTAESRINETQIGNGNGIAFVDYVMGDHENHPIVFGLDGIHMIGSGQTGSHPALINGKFSGLTPNPRTIAAQVSGVSFTALRQHTTNSFAQEFIQNYIKISNFVGITNVPSTFTFQNLLQEDNAIYANIFNHSGNTFNPSGYLNEKWRTRIIPAWDATIRSHFEDGYIFNSYGGLTLPSNLLGYFYNQKLNSNIPYFHNYETFTVNDIEARYFKDGNGLNVLRKPFPRQKGGNSYYGGIKPILWTGSSNGQNINSGYFRNPATNDERFTWHGLYLNDSQLTNNFSSEQLSRFVRVGANKTSFDQLTSIEKRICAYKSLVYDIANLRFQYRSRDTGTYAANHVPWITKPQNLYGTTSGDIRMWFEMIYHLIVHGFEYLQYWIDDNELFGTVSIGKSSVSFEELLDGILKSWYALSNNNNVSACSNSNGLSTSPLDRIVIDDAMNKGFISGGVIVGTTPRIWRITAPPTKITNNKLYFERYSDEQDLPRYIVVDTTNIKNGLGAWIVKSGSGRPDYRAFIPRRDQVFALEEAESIETELAQNTIFSISPYL